MKTKSNPRKWGGRLARPNQTESHPPISGGQDGHPTAKQTIKRLWTALTWQRFGSNAHKTSTPEKISNALPRRDPKRPQVSALQIRNFLIAAFLILAAPTQANEVILAEGAPGDEEFAAIFEQQITDWKAATPAIVVRDLTTFQKTVTEQLTQETPSPLWIVLIGHGTFDERSAKFNFTGDDLSATDFAALLKDAKRPLIIINTTAASAPFLQKLSADNRIIITATKSGSEESYAHFGEYFSKAFTAAPKEADIDSDGGISLLEAFLYASNEVTDFFETQGRIATEQALIDDNGDAMGTPAKFFRGTRAIKEAKSKAKPDGLRAHQIHLIPSPAEALLTSEEKAERDRLEMQVFTLRGKKADMEEAAYYAELETLMLQLAKIYHLE
jgi:hypothetical protein